MKHAHLFQPLDVSLFLAGLKAPRAEVPAFDFTITQGAEKAAAGIARHHGFLLRMIEATGFSLDHDGFGVPARGDATEESRKDFDL